MVSKINIKSFFSIITSKLILKISKSFLQGGSNFPGKVALKLDKDILKVISKGYKTIIITGTNGKTTTTSATVNIFKQQGYEVITNNTGANMFPGIVSCFLDNFKFFKTDSTKDKVAILEVDEANVKFITEYINPEVISITNLFRDQLDRYGEVYITLEKILEGIKKSPDSTLILNGDESLLGNLSVPNPLRYYGFNNFNLGDKTIELNADAKFCTVCKSPYKYNFITYNHLGDFFCDNCGYKKPLLDYHIDEVITLTSKGSSFIINNTEFFMPQSGTYNIYNALCAYSIAKFFNIEDSIISTSLLKQDASFGRQESIDIDGKEVNIILVKNPAGYNQAIDTLSLSKDSMSIAFLLNDNYADGRDVSWIWDVSFDKLNNLPICDVIIGGYRKYDMAVRLKISGLNKNNFKLSASDDEVLNNIIGCQSNKVYVLTTYTAMINFRKHLNSKGYLKKLW
ncbi:Mur ligase family protein [Clostridium putrefaciens]|uniref:Lipid II isoglutaminyl synthase (glutamine-hydrolyzing) subunit MurT n=1 Tax=Clostridium putrefaciens TaxID=99675 RepID=A0A381J6B7_9CLOT|nr:Mur ligase family protein [Clostridium putrefaciens]